MSNNFYDKVAKKFGGYGFSSNKPQVTKEYPTNDPEEIFKTKLLDLSGKDKVALDIGCGDGKFAFGIAEHFRHIQGIDNSEGLIKIALSKKEELEVENIDFKLEDASQMSFPDESFDIAFCRRGPSFYEEYYRVLKNGGYYLEIGIGEKDCADIKRVFGRGQNYGEWDNSRLAKDQSVLKQIGFEIVYAEEFPYSEFYPSFEELENFLEGVPIFEDFDSEGDKKYLEEYVKQFQRDKGILLPRHRVVLIARKM